MIAAKSTGNTTCYDEIYRKGAYGKQDPTADTSWKNLKNSAELAVQVHLKFEVNPLTSGFWYPLD